MKTYTLLLLLIMTCLITYGQNSDTYAIDKPTLEDASFELERFSRDQRRATAFYVAGIVVNLLSVPFYQDDPDFALTLQIVGGGSGMVGWVLDRASYRHMTRAAMFLRITPTELPKTEATPTNNETIKPQQRAEKSPGQLDSIEKSDLLWDLKFKGFVNRSDSLLKLVEAHCTKNDIPVITCQWMKGVLSQFKSEAEEVYLLQNDFSRHISSIGSLILELESNLSEYRATSIEKNIAKGILIELNNFLNALRAK